MLQDLAELEQSKRGDLLRTDEGVIELPYVSTDGGELTIRSNTSVLEGPGAGDLYLSVTNIGSDAKDFKLSFYMPDEESEPQVLRQWMYNIPTEHEVVESGSLAQYCESGWTLRETGTEEESGSEDSAMMHVCASTGEDLPCDS